MNSRGNAFVYILIAVVLFGGLTYALTSADQGNDVTELDDGRAAIAANQIFAYSAAAKNAIAALDQMGTGTDQINFIIPSNGAFNTGSNQNKLFHPEGGGLSYKALPVDALDPTYSDTTPAGLYVGRFNNFEWTPTSAFDVVFSAWGLTKKACVSLNEKVNGTPTLPTLTKVQMRGMLVDTIYGGTANTAATVAACGACDGRPAGCIQSSTTPYIYTFYSILVSR